MDYNFKKFEGRNNKTEDRITVTKSESIGFPQRFFQQNNINNFNYAVIYWDKEKLALAIRFTNDENEKSKFKIIKSKDGYGGAIVVRSFFKTNGIKASDYYGRYEWEKVDLDGEGQVYVINLIRKDSSEPVSA